MHKYFNRFGCAACCQFQEQGKVLRKLLANSKDKSQKHAIKALLLHIHAHVRMHMANVSTPTLLGKAVNRLRLRSMSVCVHKELFIFLSVAMKIQLAAEALINGA